MHVVYCAPYVDGTRRLGVMLDRRRGDYYTMDFYLWKYSIMLQLWRVRN